MKTPVKYGPLTIYSWGADLMCFGGWLVLSRLRGEGCKTRVYWSPDGTPSNPRRRMLFRW